MKSHRLGTSSRTTKLLLAAMALSSTFAFGCIGDAGYDLGDGDGGSGGSSNVGGGGPGTGAGAGSGTGAGSSTGSGGEGGTPVQPASFEVSFDDAAPQIDLRDQREVMVYLAPNGYEGPVDLTLDGLPPDVSGQLGAATLTLNGASTASTKLTFGTQSSTVTGAFEVTVSGSVEGGTKMATATLTVRPIITIRIPQGLNNMLGSSGSPNTTAFGDFPTMIKALPDMSAQNTITVHFFNADSVPHRIHAGNANQGFPHGEVNIPPGQLDPMVRQVNTPGTYTYYPHDLNNTILGRITIQ